MQKIEILKINTNYEGTKYLTIIIYEMVLDWYSYLELNAFWPKLKHLTCVSVKKPFLTTRPFEPPGFIAGSFWDNLT